MVVLLIIAALLIIGAITFLYKPTYAVYIKGTQVGYTEDKLKEENIPYVKSKFMFSGNGKAVSLGEAEGFVKILAKEDLSEIYGFQVQGSDYSKTKDGVVINDIKSKRNDLAHGTFSFAEIGRDYSYQDVEDLSNCTINFLEYIIGNMDTIQKKKVGHQVCGTKKSRRPAPHARAERASRAAKARKCSRCLFSLRGVK